MDTIFSEFFSTALKLFALMTPPAVLSAFLSETKSYSAERKRSTAIHTGVAVFVIGVVLYFFGESIFGIFGFTLDAFRIGSGVLLFLTAVSLMNETMDHQAMSGDEDISVVPLAIPLCMGPASIGTVMVMGASAVSLRERLIGASALLVASGGILLLLLMAESVEKVLRRTGIAVLSKLTGLLLAAIAAQVIFTGIHSFLQ
ncbi:MAG: NAAT family transporter [Desulfovibrionaceae bacterium]|nr:NAAT family transporter [Desulfovibrionaceae bacterium]